MQLLCESCEQTFEGRKRTNAFGVFCTSADCRRAYNAVRMRAFGRKKKLELGRPYYAPYREGARERQRERVAAGLELPWRQRYPELAMITDARRRILLGEGESFSRHEIGVRDGWVCGICTEAIDPDLVYPDPDSQSLDHVVPLSKEGPHTRDNTRIAHLLCNVRRGNRD